MFFKQNGAISTLNGKPPTFADYFTFLGSNTSSTEREINIGIWNVGTALSKLSMIVKTDLPDKIKRKHF